jgi:hypothetical protein
MNHDDDLVISGYECPTCGASPRQECWDMRTTNWTGITMRPHRERTLNAHQQWRMRGLMR